MKERPILMSGAMVCALLEGRKTQTRRVVKHRYDWHIEDQDDGRDWPWHPDYVTGGEWDGWMPCPYGKPGDRLWVREAWRVHESLDDQPPRSLCWGPQVEYLAGGVRLGHAAHTFKGRGRPSIHMPRWACRLVLEITDVRVQRLQDISAEDCIAEGLSTTLREHDAVVDLRDQWQRLWTSINGADSWTANPWVWAVTFKRVDP